jgi:hypothetical protein
MFYVTALVIMVLFSSCLCSFLHKKIVTKIGRIPP